MKAVVIYQDGKKQEYINVEAVNKAKNYIYITSRSDDELSNTRIPGSAVKEIKMKGL
ncbi:hypothetical protein [Thomasclavelia sp.]|uniref:hypothetical protein n=1 Tax=Thomasclavelia sp. TaxID=3025757 RepID=UPI0025D3CF9C|nr:hypothetical protein [Thomasclavelia sp.]